MKYEVTKSMTGNSWTIVKGGENLAAFGIKHKALAEKVCEFLNKSEQATAQERLFA